MSESGLSIREQDCENCVLVEVVGEVDIFTCQQLKDTLYQLIDRYEKDLVLDCANLNYIDSTGLGVFVAVLKKVRQAGCSVSLKNLKESVLKLFHITKLDMLFNITHDECGCINS